MNSLLKAWFSENFTRPRCCAARVQSGPFICAVGTNSFLTRIHDTLVFSVYNRSKDFYPNIRAPPLNNILAPVVEFSIEQEKEDSLADTICHRKEDVLDQVWASAWGLRRLQLSAGGGSHVGQLLVPAADTIQSGNSPGWAWAPTRKSLSALRVYCEWAEAVNSNQHRGHLRGCITLFVS